MQPLTLVVACVQGCVRSTLLAQLCGPLCGELAGHLESAARLAATIPAEAVATLGGRNCHMPNALLTPLQVTQKACMDWKTLLSYLAVGLFDSQQVTNVSDVARLCFDP